MMSMNRPIPKYSCGSDDITFCVSENNCDNVECFRHISNIINPHLPHSVAVLDGTDICPLVTTHDSESLLTELNN